MNYISIDDKMTEKTVLVLGCYLVHVGLTSILGEGYNIKTYPTLDGILEKYPLHVEQNGRRPVVILD